MKGHCFSPADARLLEQIIQQRRDVRGNRFHPDPIPEADIDRILLAALNAPSVGFSQPWEFITITDRETRQHIQASFTHENERAESLFNDDRSVQYQRLKLEGILEAPLNIAVFYKPATETVLGQTSMSEVGRYSVVCAIQNMWLMARSLNIGMGWVSILDPSIVKQRLNVPEDRVLVGYLCLGYVDEFYTEPELERLQWEKRKQKQTVVYKERHGEG